MKKKAYLVLLRELPDGGLLAEDIRDGTNRTLPPDTEVLPFGENVYADKPATFGVRLSNRLKDHFRKTDAPEGSEPGDEAQKPTPG